MGAPRPGRLHAAALEHLVADEVALGLDVLGPSVMDRVLGQLDAALVVLDDGQGLLAFGVMMPTLVFLAR